MATVEPHETIELIRRSVIGEDEAIATPFGLRRVTYADYTASGRSLSFIEDFVRGTVLPLYANTHTESSGTGLQTTRFREDARRIIRGACGANEVDHAVVFCGSGSTGAIAKLIDCLQLQLPADLDDRYGLLERIPADERPVVYIGPYEHHSNELPWRESIADLVIVPEDHDGRIDLGALERSLVEHEARPLKIGSFSAASNVTGILSDVRAISALLHRHGALSCWDFAAAAPYVGIEMAPPGDGADDLDAVFLSPHKFVGGPGTPGVLVARRALFHNRVPSVPGGGTVAYVNPTEHVYLGAIEHREEGGTPAIVESIRAGLVFQLKQAVGVEAIREREESFTHRAMHRWEENPAIEILGSHDLSSALDRVVRGASRRPVPASQLRRGRAERPVRDPGEGRLLMCRSVRAQAARHRPQHLARVRAPDRERMRGHQAGVGAGELQLLHQRDGVRLRGRCRGPGGDRGVAPAPPLPVRADERDVATRRRATGAADDAR
jgi:selenocysteine lyase/cysteine desulfurase